MKHLRVLPFLFLASLFVAGPCRSVQAQSSAEKKLDPATEAAYRKLTSAIDPTRLDAHIRALSAISSRVAGYPGAHHAADYVADQFRKAGLTGVQMESFDVTVPVSDGLRVHDMMGLVGKLTQSAPDPADPPYTWTAAQYLRSHLSPATLSLVDSCKAPLAEFTSLDARYQPARPTSPNGQPSMPMDQYLKLESQRQKALDQINYALGKVSTTLVDDLVVLTEGSSLYADGAFKGVPVTEEARKLLQTNPTGKSLAHLNAIALQQAFRGKDAQGNAHDLFVILGAWMQVGAARVPLYPLWPNQVQTSKLPEATDDGREGGLVAPLIDVGRGKLADFNGKTVDGSVVMVEFNSAQDWLNAPRLGAKAVLFVEPDSTQRGEAEGKFISIPLAIPRFWISRKDADAIRAKYQLASDGNYLVPQTRLSSEVFWEKRVARNVIGWVEGTDPKFKNQVIVVESYYDSMSVVPDLAPGAEAACGVATQIELARLYAGMKPKRSMLFLSTGAHHIGLKGIRSYMERHFAEHELPPIKDRFMSWAGNHSTPAGKILMTLVLAGLLVVVARGIGTSRGFGKWSRLAFAALVLFSLVRFDTLSPRAEQPRKRWFVFTALDLSSKTPRVGMFYKGMYYDFRQDIQRQFADFARVQRENAEQIVKKVIGGDPKELFADGVNPISGKDWRNFIPGKIALDNEPVTMAGACGVGFVTTDDGRPYVDTPFDTPEKVSVFNLSRQARLLAALYYNMVTDNNDPQAPVELALPVTEPSSFSRMTLTGGFARLDARVVQFDPKRSFIPDREVPNGLAVVENGNKSYMGVRGPLIEQVDEHGSVSFAGVAPLTAYGYNRATYLSGYHIDDATGAIDYAPDLGVTGAKDYPLEQYITTGSKQATIVVFKCISTSLYDLVDPQMLRALTSLTVLDGQSNAEPRMYGSAIARPEAWISHVDDAAVIFSQPGTRIKVLMGAGPIATRFALIKSTPQNPEGEGYPTQVSGAIYNTAYQVANDMWSMDEYRIGRLAKYRIINQGVDDLHGNSPLLRVQDLAKPGALIQQLKSQSSPVVADLRSRFSDSLRQQIDGFQGTGKPSQLLQATLVGELNTIVEGKDSLYDAQRFSGVKLSEGTKRLAGDNPNGVRLALLNRLLLQETFPRELSKRQPGGAAYELYAAEKAKKANDYEAFDAHSRAAWGYESRAYPDVQQTAQDVVKGVLFYLWLLLPFSFFVERLIWGFSDLRRQLLYALGVFIVIFVVLLNVHPAFEITMNPLIVLLAFIMLALALMIIVLVIGKFEQQLKEYQKAVGGVHKADIGRAGVAIAAFSLGVSNMRKRKARTIFTCITLIILTFTVLSFTSVVTGMRFNKVPSPGQPGYQGLMIRDALWSPLEESAYRVMLDEFGAQHGVAPRAWFFANAYGDQSFVRITGNKNVAGYDCKAVIGLTAEERYVTKPQRALACGRWLQPDDRYAAVLPEAVADTLGIDERNYQTSTVRFSGTDFQVVGILNNSIFKGVRDLDREPLTPVDFITMEKLRQQGKDLGEAGFREYVHLEPDNIIIVPFQTIMNLGGGLRSIGMDFADRKVVDDTLQKLMPRLGMNLYAGMGSHIFRYSSIAATSITGIGDLMIPVLIAALIVLNTMLGSVFERLKEIHIFSSIGLAPSHVGILFMAEAFVYAVLGAISGYLLGQITVKIIAEADLFQGLALNFSSLSAVFSTILVIFVVLGSTLYPSRKASQVATPAIERSWKVPDPQGDEWRIPLPFSVTGDQAIALNRFLSEWFAAYEEYSIGDFVTQDVKLSEGHEELGQNFSIKLMAWLAPFDLGVSQHVELRTTPTTMEDVYDLTLFVRRESGDVSNWKRVNRRFLNTLRKQFLIWRTLGSEDRERYLAAREEAAATSVGAPVA